MLTAVQYTANEIQHSPHSVSSSLIYWSYTKALLVSPNRRYEKWYDLHAMDDVPKFILDISVSDGLDVKRQPTVELKAGLVQQANLLHVAQLQKNIQ